MSKSQNLLGIAEVCAYFNLSESSIRRKVRASREGKGNFPLPLFKSGCRVLWRKSDVENWAGEDAEVLSFSASPTAPVQAESLSEARKRLAKEFGISLSQTGDESNN